MKKTLILGLVFILLLPLLMLGCTSSEAKTIELTLDDFSAQNNMVKDVTLTPDSSLTVKLGSNATTGYSWGEAVISTAAVIAQASREFVAPTATGLVGAPGTDVWVFNAKAAGTTTIKMSYGRPWEGGEKDTFTLTINVTVK
jgi:inhibitor of cysteine peptidase